MTPAQQMMYLNDETGADSYGGRGVEKFDTLVEAEAFMRSKGNAPV